ncbi:uncharacterized protein LOC125490830 [Plutella xylostella]|uniref:uncharacterized protein LOC125490830 n=1 Tax=Plutella xylostella TaxID=51655 RepID=UPI0020328AD1|nr:uncharacterized protein LOC125490830 [Plutella xylostella]
MSNDDAKSGDVREGGSKNRVSTDARHDIFRVGVKSPQFSPEKPAIWFALMEAQFNLSKITSDETKFYHILSNLEPQYADLVEELVLNPPATDKYEKLKTELIRTLSQSKAKKLQRLLDREEIGDRKPSHFLRHLRNLAGPGLPEEFLSGIWTSRLPSSIQTILASQPTASLETLADLADRIHEVVPPSPQVASTSHHTSPGSSMDQMAKQIAELTQQVRALSMQSHRSRSRSRNNHAQTRHSARSRERSQSSYRKHPLCWYHGKFGSRAKTCIRPCDYKAENSLGNQ